MELDLTTTERLPDSPPSVRPSANVSAPVVKKKKRKIEPWRSPPRIDIRKRRVATSASTSTSTALVVHPAFTLASAEVRQATTSRTSIAARPQPPREAAAAAARDRVNRDRNLLRTDGYTEQAADLTVQRDDGAGAAPNGPSVRFNDKDKSKQKQGQLLANHLVTVRSKSVTNQARHGSWQLAKRCPLTGHHLLEAAMRANSVNAVLFGKKASESSSLQISRYNFLPIAEAQAAQQMSCLLTLATARGNLGGYSAEVGVSFGVSMSDLFELKEEGVCAVFPVPASVQLVPNAVPLKLTDVSMGSVGRDLARAELGPKRTITEQAGTVYTTLLRRLCQQCAGQSASGADALWSSVGLLSYCSMTAAGRALLGSTNLTDFDYALAVVLDTYGRSEIQRRERFDGSATGEDGASAAASSSSASAVADADADADANPIVARMQLVARQELAATEARLSSKKRRDASSVDPILSAHWWVSASETKHAAVLKTLMAVTLRDAERAAMDNLKYQSREMPEVVENATLQEVSLQNARECVRAIAEGLACRQSYEVPVFHRVEEGNRDAPWLLRRTRDELKKTAVFASKLAPAELQPSGKRAIAWTLASIEPKVQSVFDRLRQAEKIRARDGGKKGLLRAERIEQEALLRSEGAKSPRGAALARSFFAHALRCTLTGSQTDAARRLAYMTRRAEGHPEWEAHPLKEPFADTSPGMATGLLVTDLLTRWIAGKPRKVDFCKLQLGPSTAGEQPAAIQDLNSSAPLPLAVITDVRASANLVEDDEFSVGLSLALDGAVRLPEALHQLQGNNYNATTVQQCRALLWAGVAQASLIGNLGNVLTSGAINTSISNSRRLTVADNTKWLGLSAFDCFTGGLLNVEPSFLGSAYAGAYGPVFDSGLSPPGKDGANLKHDGRQHGSFSLSQDLSDQLAGFFATKHFAVCEDTKSYAPTPVATRGIPHMMIAGVHSALDDYVDSLEHLRELTGRTHAKTVEGVFALPYSGVTQALAPVAEEFADAAQTCGVRSDHVKRGHAYQPTMTSEDDALLREPLFRRPSVASVYDNPFANAYDYAETFYNLANGMVLLGRLDNPDMPPAVRVDTFFRELCAWVEDDDDAPHKDPANAYYADALLMIACMFPVSHEIGKHMVPEFLAVGIPALQRALRSTAKDADLEALPSLHLRALVDDELYAAGRAFVAKLRRAWPRLAPLLQRLDRLDGRHDLSSKERTELRTAFERAVQASYYFQLDDAGEITYGNPAYGTKGPEEIRRMHLDPVIVGIEEERAEARGGLIGMKPHALRQVALLAKGAHLDGVQVQVARNEGGMAIRVSSAPDVLDALGKPRTNKASSPVQMESDAKLFGTREEKLTTCRLQRIAWDRNALLLAPVLAEVSPPRPPEYRRRCVHGAHRAVAAAAVAAHNDFTMTDDEAVARQHILAAARFERRTRHGGHSEP